MGMAECKDCVHKFVCETLKGKIKNSWAETCVAYRHKETCVNVVQCKDCEHLECGYKCYRVLGAILSDRNYMLVEPGDFCSYGKRREGE